MHGWRFNRFKVKLFSSLNVIVSDQHRNRSQPLLYRTYSEDEMDGGHAGCGHDFGTVGDQVEEYWHDGLCCVIEPVAEHWRQVSDGWRGRQMDSFQLCTNDRQEETISLVLFSFSFILWAMCLTPEWCRPPSPPEIAGPWQTAWTPPPWDAAAAGSRRTLVHRPVAANALSSAGGAQKKFSTHTPSLIFQTEARAKVRTCPYSCHSQLPVPLVVRQHVTNLRHGFLHLPVRVDLMEERERRRSTHEQESYSLQMETVSRLKYMSHMY